MPKQSFQLIEELTNKNIIFNNESEKKRALYCIERYSYSNLMSLKYLFSTGVDSSNNRLEYSKTTKYRDLEKKYLELIKFENKIRDSLLEYEIELKVHLTNFLIHFLREMNISNFKDFLNQLYSWKKVTNSYCLEGRIKMKIDDEWKNEILPFTPHYQDYNSYYYLVIKNLSFGSILVFLFTTFRNNPNDGKIHPTLYSHFSDYLKKEKIKFNIGKNYTGLYSLKILRNSLCHKESIITFLDKGYRRNQQTLDLRIQAINNIVLYRNKSLGKVKSLPHDCWIVKFSNYRLNNKNFKKIKINI